MHENDVFIHTSAISMHENEYFDPIKNDYFVPEMSEGYWAVHNFMHGDLTREYSGAFKKNMHENFISMDGNFMSLFSCMKLFVLVYTPFSQISG